MNGEVNKKVSRTEKWCMAFSGLYGGGRRAEDVSSDWWGLDPQRRGHAVRHSRADGVPCLFPFESHGSRLHGDDAEKWRTRDSSFPCRKESMPFRVLAAISRDLRLDVGAALLLQFDQSHHPRRNDSAPWNYSVLRYIESPEGVAAQKDRHPRSHQRRHPGHGLFMLPQAEKFTAGPLTRKWMRASGLALRRFSMFVRAIFRIFLHPSPGGRRLSFFFLNALLIRVDL